MDFDPFKDIIEFHEKFGLKYEGPPRVLPPSLAQFREKFIREEFREYLSSACQARDELNGVTKSFDDEVAFHLEHALDALVDLVYVVLGTAYLHGFDFREAWRRVHAANMAKTRAPSSSDSKRKNRHDVIKPPGWQPPRLRSLVINHAHQMHSKKAA
jgi:predicted HAD superfamily Cof-like phosphohydrolase